MLSGKPAPPGLALQKGAPLDIFEHCTLIDNAEFLHHLWPELVGAETVAFAESLKHQLPQVIAWQRTVWWCERRELWFSKGKREVASFGYLKCM